MYDFINIYLESLQFVKKKEKKKKRDGKTKWKYFRELRNSNIPDEVILTYFSADVQ